MDYARYCAYGLKRAESPANVRTPDRISTQPRTRAACTCSRWWPLPLWALRVRFGDDFDRPPFPMSILAPGRVHHVNTRRRLTRPRRSSPPTEPGGLGHPLNRATRVGSSLMVCQSSFFSQMGASASADDQGTSQSTTTRVRNY
jgi:hypothetical protein